MNPSQMPDGQLADETKTAVPAVEVPIAPPIAPPGQKLEESEMLKMENYYLKLQMLQGQIETLDLRKQMVFESMKELSVELEQYRASLSKKYNTPIGPGAVDGEGNIRARTPTSDSVAFPGVVRAT